MRNLKEYVRARSVDEALEIKERLGPRAAYLAGGTDLLVCRPEEVETVIDIRHAGLRYIRDDGDAFIIGGAALLRDAEQRSGHIAGGMLTKALRDTAPWLIRNTATVAGNIANASPAADSVPALIALDAEIVLSENKRRVPILDIYVGPHRTTLENVLIEEIRIPVEANSLHAHFFKLARSASDIALVNIAVSCDVRHGVMTRVRISLGAVGPMPLRAVLTEQILEGHRAEPELLLKASESVKQEISPISDWRASAEYRTRMSGVLLRRALEEVSGVAGKVGTK